MAENTGAIGAEIAKTVGKVFDFFTAGQLKKKAEQEYLNSGVPEPFNEYYNNYLAQNTNIYIIALLAIILIFLILGNVLIRVFLRPKGN